ncbi:hypothetical protein COLO4_36521 [Corchorus olitorius]|uniref:Uncharacterized protein n=1 Tax=Corchorus olitorius TaxID=93759 RepID=A0A1R3G8C0_9ROSI|nr:hypothetical protein COLO4_36521 [Corchorus olitorius]
MHAYCQKENAMPNATQLKSPIPLVTATFLFVTFFLPVYA